MLTDRIGVPVYVENDAGCAALAEAFDDGKIVVDSLVMLTIGTGVGGGWVLDGKLYRGATTSAAEVGHTIIGRDVQFGNHVPGDPFPQRGSLETLASGRALDRLADYAARAVPGLLPRQGHGQEGQRATGTTWSPAPRPATTPACGACACSASGSGSGSRTPSTRSTRSEVVIGGGVSRAGDRCCSSRPRTPRSGTSCPGSGLNTTIRIARHGPRAGVLGAALIAAQEYAEDTGRNLQGAISGEGG